MTNQVCPNAGIQLLFPIHSKMKRQIKGEQEKEVLQAEVKR